MEKAINIGIRFLIAAATAILSHITVIVNLYDLFTDCAQLEAVLFSVFVVLMMAAVCFANLRDENKKPLAVAFLLILSFLSVYWSIGFCDYLKNGFRIMIYSNNVTKQLFRIAVISSLTLMPFCTISVKIIRIRK